MLNRPIYRYFTLFMAFVVLSSSMGIGLLENECSMRGKSVDLVFKDKKKGCKLCRAPRKEVRAKNSDDQPVFRKSHCCIEKKQLKIVEFQVTTGKQLEKSVKDSSSSILTSWFTDSFSRILSNATGHSPFVVAVSFSSLHFGRSMLLFVQSFLI